MKCSTCGQAAKIKTAKDARLRCVACFLSWFEQDVHATIVRTRIFERGERIAVGESGGKDSTVLAHILHTLNQRHDYALDLVLICVDEGISGYRDDSIREVRKNESDLGLRLTIVGYKQLYGWTMDEIVAKIGKKNNCTFCGVFRRQALDRGALREGATKLVTGHNADDLAETVVMNFLRGDVARLQRTAASISPGEEGHSLPRVKPLRYSYEKDIVMYAHFKRLNYHSMECIYSPNSYRGNARNFIKSLERERPKAILDLVHSGETVKVSGEVKRQLLTSCQKCGYIASQQYCKACLLLYGLNNGNYSIGVSGKKRNIPKSLSLNGLNGEREVAATERNDLDSNGCGGGCSCANGVPVEI